jgi:hypothetical protein
MTTARTAGADEEGIMVAVRKRFGAIALLAALALAAGCGDGGGAAADDDAGVGTDAGEDAGPIGESLTVNVTVGSCDPIAVEGVLVTLDAPGGARVEEYADPAGSVTFEGLDFAYGTAAVTASKGGYQMVTHLGIGAGQGELDILLPGAATTVELSGTASGMADAGHLLLVEATACGSGSAQELGAAYDLPVAAGAPFSVIATELTTATTASGQGVEQAFYRWFRADHEAIDGATTYDFAFAEEPLPWSSATGSFDLSLRPESPLAGDRGYGYVQVADFADAWLTGIGWPTAIDIDADATAFDYEVGYLDDDSVVRPVTTYQIVSKDGSTAAAALVREAGFPESGSHAPAFVDVPLVAPGSGEEGAHILSNGAFSWEAFDEDVRVSLLVNVGAAGTVWWIHAPAGATTMVVPEPPGGADATALMEGYTGTMIGYLWLWRPGEADLEGVPYAAIAQSDALTLQFE